jgi:thioredoxin 1
LVFKFLNVAVRAGSVQQPTKNKNKRAVGPRTALLLQPNQRRGCSSRRFFQSHTSNFYFFKKMALQLSDATFEQDVLQSDKLTVVDFWAEWCGPCKMMNPVLDELSAEYGDQVTIAKMNVDDNSEVPTNFNIRGIPTFILFKGGNEVGRIVGAQTKAFMKAKIDEKI